MEISITSIVLLSLCPVAVILVSLVFLDALGIKNDKKSLVTFGVVLLFAVSLGSPIFFDVLEGAVSIGRGENLSLVIFSLNRVVFVSALFVAALRAGSLVIELPLSWYMGKIESEWVSSLRVLTAVLLVTLSFDLFGALLSSELNPRSILQAFKG